MCYPCSHCNACGREPLPGTCGFCGHVNGEGARVCQKCGIPFPPPPGKPKGSGEKKADDGQ